MLAVQAGPAPTLREIRFDPSESTSAVRSFGEGRGVALFDADPALHGLDAYTAQQYLYLGHDGFAAMDFASGGGREPGRIRLRGTSEVAVPLADLFRWERPTAEGWKPIDVVHEADLVRGLPDVSVVAHLPDLAPVTHFGTDEAPIPMPEDWSTQWIRGAVDYERWLAARMHEDLQIVWQDDRGGDERTLANWAVRNTGRALEFQIQDLPPIREGWTLRFAVVDRGMAAGRSGYFPRYRFSYRRADRWETIPDERVRMAGPSILISGPLPELASDGYNLRAERVETVHLPALIPDLGVQAAWLRPLEVHLAAGSDINNAQSLAQGLLPAEPFSPAMGAARCDGPQAVRGHGAVRGTSLRRGPHRAGLVLRGRGRGRRGS